MVNDKEYFKDVMKIALGIVLGVVSAVCILFILGVIASGVGLLVAQLMS
ncbi:hypothetical protein [Methanocorpusculum labreanum]|nr:hypothetical protein [Methanocorpusculum labreanum]